jgi:hypothetical protein
MPPFDRLRGYFRLPAHPLGRPGRAQPRLGRALKRLGEAKRSPSFQTGRALRRMVARACYAKSPRRAANALTAYRNVDILSLRGNRVMGQGESILPCRALVQAARSLPRGTS